MKIDIGRQLENADGTFARNGDGVPVTLKDILIGSLLAPVEEDAKIKHYSLYRDLRKTKVGFVSWSAEDVVIAKKAVLRTQPTLVAGQAYEMLESEYEHRIEVAPSDLSVIPGETHPL